MREWKGTKVVIVGAARQGTALARYLVRRGAHVVINDCKTEEELLSSRKALEDLSNAGFPLTWVFGGHPLDLLESCQALFISGGVPLTLPLVQEAKSRQITLLNDSQLFLEDAPCKVIGITGSAGKTTTTTLVGRILETATSDPKWQHYGKRIWVGGNIGTPMISFMDGIQPDDLAVMELSSFQLEIMTSSPEVAVVLNISPDHFDRHESLDVYIQAKSHILAYQNSSGVAILGRDDPYVFSLKKVVRGQMFSFGLSNLTADQLGTYILGDSICLRKRSVDTNLGDITAENRQNAYGDKQVLSRDGISLPGNHNLRNVMAASTIAAILEISPEIIQNVVESFKGVPHRLEFIRNWGGANWYNDSIATTPNRAIAAIESFDKPLVLLAGGRDKKLPWEEFALLVRKRVDHLIVFGEAAPVILQALHLNGTESFSVTECKRLNQAVDAAAKIVRDGDIVLLSPGGTSFDEFQNYEERGEWFRARVMALP